MLSLLMTTRYAMCDSIVSEQLDGEAVVLYLPSSTYYRLNPVAALVWQTLRERPTLQILQDTVCAKFAIEGSTFRRDLTQLLEDLERQGLLRTIPS